MQRCKILWRNLTYSAMEIQRDMKSWLYRSTEFYNVLSLSQCHHIFICLSIYNHDEIPTLTIIEDIIPLRRARHS